MDVSKCEVESHGQELIDQIAESSGLPASWMREELNQILDQFGQKSDGITLDQLRQVMIAYLESIKPEFDEPSA
jgi:hypothetical protein